MDELYEWWRREHPDAAAQAEDVAAIACAIEDYIQGDRGRPAGDLCRELRQALDADAGS